MFLCLCHLYFPPSEEHSPQLSPNSVHILGYPSVNHALRTKPSMNHPALPPTGLSPAAFQVRQNAEILQKLLQTQPTQNHEAKGNRLWSSFQRFQTNPIEAQQNYYKLLGHCQESRDLYHNARDAAASVSETHTTICATVTSLTRQLMGTNQPALEEQQRVALAQQLAVAVVEHDKVFDQMELFEREAENLRRWWGYYWREAKTSLELAGSLWEELEILATEVGDIMEELGRLWDENHKGGNEVENEEAVVRRPLGMD